MPPVTDIIKPVDPVAEAIRYLSPYFPGAVFGLSVPASWEWGPLLVVVTDTGGPGEHDVVLDEANLTIEVSHEDAEVASDTARTIHGLLKAWPMANRAVYWRRTLQRPTYTPDEETEVPAYSLTVTLNFRMTTETVEIP